MPKRPRHQSMRVLISACTLLLSISMASAQSLDSSVQVEQQINENSASSQTRVSGLARQTQDLLTQYRLLVRETQERPAK